MVDERPEEMVSTDEDGSTTITIEMPPALEPRTKDKETGEYSREIPHKREVLERKKELLDKKSARKAKKPETIEEQMIMAQEEMQEAMSPPRSRREARAMRKSNKSRGKGFTKPKNDRRKK